MIHVSKKLDLTQSPLRVNFIVKSISYLLQSHVLIRLRIQSRACFRKEKSRTKLINQRKEIELCGSRGEHLVPNDAVCPFSDRHDWGFVFSSDLEDVAEDIVLDESAAVAEVGRYVVHRRLWQRLCFRHHGVRRRSPTLHFFLCESRKLIKRGKIETCTKTSCTTLSL